MNTQSNTIPGSHLETHAIAPTVIPESRRLYWLVRRELWEYRSIYIAPLAVAALYLLGFMISMTRRPHSMRALSALDPMRQHALIQQPYDFAALLIMGTTALIGIFYCLDALYGERRDRSILFWKSLPVSDLTTVLSKASIPLVVLPLLTFTITVVTQLLMLLVSAVVLTGSGLSLSPLSQLPLFQMSLELLYHLVAVHSLYYAPIFAWLLLVSAWARRAPVLWAALPLFAIGFVEKVAFNTSHFLSMLGSRVGGGGEAAPFPLPAGGSMESMTHLAPVSFLISPGLWIGLMVAAAFLAGAVWLRRNQGPV